MIRTWTASALTLILLSGCASVYPECEKYTQAEQSSDKLNQCHRRVAGDREIIDRENWRVCKKLYAASEVSTQSRHAHRKNYPHRRDQVRDDLAINRCRILMGKERWISY